MPFPLSSGTHLARSENIWVHMVAALMVSTTPGSKESGSPPKQTLSDERPSLEAQPAKDAMPRGDIQKPSTSFLSR